MLIRVVSIRTFVKRIASLAVGTPPGRAGFQPRHLRFESVECRRLMAADAGDLSGQSDSELPSLVGDWTTFGGGADHRGYFAGTVGDSPRARLRFEIEADYAIQQVAVAEGRLYATPRIFYGVPFVEAFDESTGDSLWRRDFAAAATISPPSFADGHVYLQRGNHGGNSQLWSVNAEDGRALWSTNFSTQWSEFFAPAVTDQRILVNAGYYGGMQAFDQADGQSLFFEDLAQYDEWTPSYAHGVAYYYVAGAFTAHDPDDGQRQWTVDVPWDWHGWSMETVAAIDQSIAYVRGTSGIHAIDLDNESLLWTAQGRFSGSPAVGNDAVFAINDSSLHRFDRLTGQPAGVFVAPQTLLSQQPIVTDDAVLVSGSTQTYVFDLQTQEILLTIPAAGALSLANDTLYVASSFVGSEGVSAYDLLLLPSLTLDGPAESTEGQGALTWTVSIDEVADRDLLVALQSSDDASLSLPPSVRIPAGASSATFTIEVLDDESLNWHRHVDVTATTAGLYDANRSMRIADDETTTIEVRLPEVVIEGDGTLASAGRVVAGQPPTSDVVVQLTSARPNGRGLADVRVPETIVLPAGQTEVTFDLVVAGNATVDGPRLVEVIAAVEGWTGGSATIRVNDDEVPPLRWQPIDDVREGDGGVSGQLHVPYALEQPLLIRLTSGDDSELAVAETIVLPAGGLSVEVPLSVIDDDAIDGSQTTSLTASADGFHSAVTPATVHDNEIATLSLEVPDAVSEAVGETVMATLRIDPAADEDLWVTLVAGDPARLAVGDRIRVPAGQRSVLVPIEVIDNHRVEGRQTVELSAIVVGWETAQAELVILDDDRFGLHGGWSTIGGGPRHTGRFPGHLGTDPRAALRWQAALGGPGTAAVIADGRVAIVAVGRFTDGLASGFDERTGQTLWTRAFDEANSFSGFTHEDGSVYFQRGNHSRDSQLWSLDAATGAVNWSAPYPEQWQNHPPPTVADGMVWFNGGSYGGLFGLDAATGQEAFFVDLPMVDEWSPSYDGTAVYSHLNGQWIAHDPATGEVVWSVEAGSSAIYRSTSPTSALVGDRAYVTGPAGLDAVDLSDRAVLWSVDRPFRGSPAADDRAVFVIDGTRVQSYDAQTGQPIGVYDTRQEIRTLQPIITDDAVIVASHQQTFVLDRMTQEILLTIDQGGTELSLANGTLFITFGSDLYAYELFDGNATDRWQNSIDRYDVDASGAATAMDALHIINRLNRGGEQLPIDTLVDRYYDVNGDGLVTAMDALWVINRLTELDARGESMAHRQRPVSEPNPLLDDRLPDAANRSDRSPDSIGGLQSIADKWVAPPATADAAIMGLWIDRSRDNDAEDVDDADDEFNSEPAVGSFLNRSFGQ